MPFYYPLSLRIPIMPDYSRRVGIPAHVLLEISPKSPPKPHNITSNTHDNKNPLIIPYTEAKRKMSIEREQKEGTMRQQTDRTNRQKEQTEQTEQQHRTERSGHDRCCRMKGIDPIHKGTGKGRGFIQRGRVRRLEKVGAKRGGNRLISQHDGVEGGEGRGGRRCDGR